MRLLSSVVFSVALCGAAGMAAAQETGQQPDELFEALDADKDGKLNASEVPEEQKRHFERLLRTGDANEDGTLTKDEFEAALSRSEQPVEAAEQPRQGDRRGPMPDFGQMFDRWDADGSGSVSLEELPEWMRDRVRPVFEDLGKDSLTKEELQRVAARAGQFNPGQRDPGQFIEMLRRLDANNDGTLELSEVPEEQRARMQGMFERAGGDSINLEEMNRRIAQFNGRPDDRRPEGDRPQPPVLKLLDGDGDGRLSKEELEKAAAKFDELDRNQDGQLDPPELFGSPEDGPQREMRRDGDRPRPARGERRRPNPDGDRESDRPRRPAADDAR